MSKFLPFLACLFTFTLGQFATLSAVAADLRAVPPKEEAIARKDQRDAGISNYLTLLLVRATFDVVSNDDVEVLLRRQLETWGSLGPSSDQIDFVNRMLLAEGSYYLVSLMYLIESGGAAFPRDRPESSYENDALVELDTLRRQLISATLDGEVALDIMLSAERIRALTEAESVASPGPSIISKHNEILTAATRSRTPMDI